MSESEKPKRPPRKHVTTACVPCRESKIRCDGASPHCKNCERKKRQCKYQHGDDKRKVSLRAATELFSARIDQLIQFIYDNGLEPPSMKPEDEAGINRVLDTLQIHRGVPKRKDSPLSEGLNTHTQPSPPSQPAHSPLPVPLYNGNTATNAKPDSSGLPLQNNLATSHTANSGANSQDSFSPFGFHFPSTNWEFALPTAESLDSLYANLNGGYQVSPENGNSCSPDSLQLSQDIAQQPGVLLEQAQALNTKYEDNDSDSGEEDEAEKDVIEQISHRIGTLKIAGDGHLRFFGATSNLNLVDVSATQQRQRPDARTVRHDGQDILNHLRVGQSVDQALEDHLLELYFTWQNTSTYVVDKEMYYTARQKWREEFDDTPFYSEVLTNAMCSIGSAFEARYHPTFITFPKSLSEFFADRAKALLEIELDSPCVATVQALVILSCHEGASNRDARGWLYSGMSMRLAFDLGLHLDMTPYVERGDMSAFEADVRRIAFWGSYVADHFWGFYLGRPFRMNAGDITVPKPASGLTVGKEGTWRPYGLPANANQEAFNGALKNPNELISRQFAVLWEIISPLGHVLYGCSDIPRHELQRYSSRITDDLFAWKANLPSILDIDLADDTTPRLPHLLMLHLQYHQIVIFTHRPWVSKSYIQPRAPRQGAGYHHARKMCIESSIAIARLLHIYEKHYTFRRMNNQVVSMIFSAALILLYVTISTTPLASQTGLETLEGNRSEMTAYLNLCFRALDELGQSFENAKRTRDFLVSLQRRWQARMRRSGALKRAQSSQRLPAGSKKDIGGNKGSTIHRDESSTRKKSRTSISTQPQAHAHTSSLFSLSSSPPHTHTNQHHTKGTVTGLGPSATSTFLPSLDPRPINLDSQNQSQSQSHAQPNDIDSWIRDSDLGILPDNITDTTTAAASAFRMSGANPNPNPNGEVDDVEIGLPSLADIEPWWDPRMEGTGHANGHEAAGVVGTSAYGDEL
ncbi:transcription factor domain-containing protein [Aspergillus mulundensis]|uniref:Putative Zn(II)2Cys6 transcription factor n=1 Tax=Aspergillus mulundensis TaxID=1810919 RepID=A0A3D8T5R2_9EURO|nr:putative Zn(II)2Cys6 transcription factor [Aspergillus mulundensis]RDW93348.1 putative Zn(II)2Cys6 transcription factor [Aspergillus mulundensis]